MAGAWEAWKRIARTMFVKEISHFRDHDVDGRMINMDLRELPGVVAGARLYGI